MVDQIDTGEALDPRDVPLDLDEESTGGDMPLSDAFLSQVGARQSSNSKVLDNHHVGQAAIMEEYISDQDVFTAYMQLDSDPDKRGMIERKAREKALTDASDIEQEFIENPGDAAAEIRANATLVREMQEEVIANGEDYPRQVVDAAAGPNADPQAVLDSYARMTVLKDIEELSQDLSIFDHVAGFAAMFVPGKAALDNFQLTGSVFSADNELRNIIVGFRELPPEQQIKDWPFIKEHLLDALPKTQALSVMARFMDPLGEEELSEFSGAWAALDIVDVTALGTALMIGLNTIRKGTNTIKLMKNLDRAEDASEINVAAIVEPSGDVASKAGIDKVTAYNNATPFNYSSVDASYADGLSGNTMRAIDEFSDQVGAVTGSAFDESRALREGVLDARDRKITEAAFRAKYEQRGYENIEILEKTTTGTTWKGTMVSENGKVDTTFTMDLKLSDVTSTFEMSERGVLSRLLGSKNVLAHGNSLDAVKQALRLDSTSSVVAKQLQELQVAAVRPLIGKTGFRLGAKARLGQIDEILRVGDDASKTYTATQLRAGINGVSLDDDQIQVYMNLRNLYNGLWAIRNNGMRRAMKIRGLNNVSTVDGNLTGKVFASANDARSSLRATGGSVRKVWDAERGKAVDITELDLDAAYLEGKTIVRLETDVLKGEESFKTMLVNKSSTGDLPDQVLKFREGYIPRVTKANFFVKQISDKSIDGVGVAGGQKTTLRQFDTRADAETFVARLSKESPDKKFVALEDRQLEKEAFGSSGGGAGGAMYTGARAKERIPFGLPEDDLVPDTLNSFEALSQNITQLSNYVSRNEWKMGMIKRWENTAKDMGVAVDGFNPAAMPDTQQGRFLRDLGEQMEEWFSFPTRSELAWEEFNRGMIEFGMNRGLKRDNPIVKGLDHLSQTDPIAAGRSAAFHTLLGFFNPVQVWVQAQGAAVALAIDPLRAPANLQRTLALTAIDFSENSALMAKAAKSVGLKTDELVELKDLWNKTGYRDSILNTADAAAAQKNQGMAADALGKVADKGLFFYRNGELFNRRFSFTTALTEWKRANKGKKVSDEALKEIMGRANNMMLNLSKSNRASWQKGILSIPTQFLQVQTKMLETLTGANQSFTRGERGRILMGQIGLYGTAGIPMGNLAIRWAQEALGMEQADIEEMDPLVVKAINEGFWGFFALAGFDADIDISRRGAITSGLESFVFDLMSSDASVSEKVMGAFGQVPHRFFKAWGRIRPMVIGNIRAREFPSKPQITMAISHASQIFSTADSLAAARFAYFMDMTRDTRGYPEDSEGFSMGDILGRAFGFRLSTSREIRELNMFSKELEGHKRQVKDWLVDNYHNYSLEIETAENEEEVDLIIDKYEQVSAVLLGSLPTENDVNDVRDALNPEITSGETKKTKAIKRYLNNFIDGRLADLHTIHAQAVSSGMIQTGVLEGKEETE